MAETERAANLGFYYPKEGVNYFVDAMCIPKSSKNPEVAKEYINFMLSAEPGIENAEYIYYASPNTLVSENEEYIEYMGEFAYSLLYDKMPEDVNGAYNEKFGTTCYKNFTPEIQTRINTLWENLKLANSTEPWIHIVSISITVVVIFAALYSVYIKKKRSRDYRLRDKAKKKKT